ncbi:MAG: hypothetical protein GXP53_05135 [Deltaproteobacteria bacterium]|nr:hypothetical protein [Deltaproteobacteria bacterium]
MNKIVKYIGYSVGTAFLVFLLLLFFNPLRRPDAMVKSWLLDMTPVGNSISQVENIIRDNGWESQGIDRTTGYPSEVDYLNKVGSSSIRASLGDYQGIPLKCNVTAFWGFDENGTLVDIRVWRTRDGI